LDGNLLRFFTDFAKSLAIFKFKLLGSSGTMPWVSQIKEWYNRFKDGATSVDSEPRHGRPSTSRNDNVIKQVRTLVMLDRRITVRELTDDLGN
jgi:hypothetical protein